MAIAIFSIEFLWLWLPPSSAWASPALRARRSAGAHGPGVRCQGVPWSVAGIYSVATLKERRGKGLGAAVTLQPLLDARAKGYYVGTLLSSDMVYEVYQRLGFKDVCRMNQYY